MWLALQHLLLYQFTNWKRKFLSKIAIIKTVSFLRLVLFFEIPKPKSASWPLFFQTTSQVPGRQPRWTDSGERLRRKLPDLRLGAAGRSVPQRQRKVRRLHLRTLLRLLVQDPHFSRLVVHDRHLGHVWVSGIFSRAPAAKLFRVLVGSLDPGCDHLQRRRHRSRHADTEVPVDEDLQLERPLDHSDVQRKNQKNICTV